MNGEDEGGLGCLTALLLIFIVLKLTGNIDWSWFWVLSPVLLPVIIVLGLIIFAAIFERTMK